MLAQLPRCNGAGTDFQNLGEYGLRSLCCYPVSAELRRQMDHQGLSLYIRHSINVYTRFSGVNQYEAISMDFSG